MNLAEKVGQLLHVGFHGLVAPDYLLEWLTEGRVGGVILFARNVESPEQVAALTASLHAAAKFPLLVSIDQEGGTVARLRTGFTESPGAMALAAGGDIQRVEEMSAVLGAEMCALGINWVYAPVLDLLYNVENPSLMTRSFGKERVGEFAAAAVRGFQSQGVAACAKHFPGLGDTAIDTHLALPALTKSVRDLIHDDLPPYIDTIDAGLATVMTTHTIYTALDTELPATLSKVIIHRLLRDELQFDGVVTTDCMEMKAISDNFGTGESAVLAALAGVDVILVSHTRATQEEAYAALLKAALSGRLPETSIDAALMRIRKLKARYPAQSPDLSIIRKPEHVATAQAAARAGIVVRNGDLPLDLSGNVVLVEFASVLESEILENGGLSGLARTVAAAHPNIKTHTLKGWELDSLQVEAALDDVINADLLILATRNAHFQAHPLQLAQEIISHARRTALVCLRSPFDSVALPGAEVVLCTCGDSTPSLQAALDALTGVFQPSGKLPVTLS